MDFYIDILGSKRLRMTLVQIFNCTFQTMCYNVIIKFEEVYMNALETIKLSKSYRGKVVLDGVSICVREGEIYGLVGRNGAGKTTLIRALLGLAKPDSGEVRINGVSTREGLEFERRKIGSLIDSPALALHLSALDNMKSAALAFGHYDVKKLRDLIERVGLDPNNPMKVKNYSLGMKQRLAIAIALIGDPSILILDEPVNGLDPAGIFEVRELLQRLNHTDHITILISSHLLSELGKVANSYGVIEGGKLVKELRSSDLEELCRPYYKVVVGDLKTALRVVVENYGAHEFEILPYNTLALYDMSKDISFVATMFAKANVPVLNIYKCEGDLESTFISLMGGLHGAETATGNDDTPVFEELAPNFEAPIGSKLDDAPEAARTTPASGDSIETMSVNDDNSAETKSTDGDGAQTAPTDGDIKAEETEGDTAENPGEGGNL